MGNIRTSKKYTYWPNGEVKTEQNMYSNGKWSFGNFNEHGKQNYYIDSDGYWRHFKVDGLVSGNNFELHEQLKTLELRTIKAKENQLKGLYHDLDHKVGSNNFYMQSTYEDTVKEIVKLSIEISELKGVIYVL